MADKQLNILIIDDDEEDYFLTKETLSEIGHIRFNVEWKDNYTDGLEATMRREHHVYLVDYRLGGEDGLQLIREAIRHGCKAPLILLTGQGDLDIDMEAMKAGASDYLVKGNIDDQLLDRSIRYALERAQTLEALVESQERFQLAVSGAKDGVWDWDYKNNNIYYSARFETMFGFEEGELGDVPDPWFNHIHPEDLQKFKKQIKKHVEDPESTHFEDELRMMTKDGVILWVLCRGNALRDDNGLVYRIAGTLTDITARKQAEKALRESEEKFRQSQKMEAVGRLAGGVAHDFNNLLTAITGYSDLVLFTADVDNEVQENVTEIKKAAQRAAGLTRQLLAFSRKQMLQLQVFCLNDVVRDFEKMMRRLIGEDIELYHHLADDLGMVKADPGQIEQVLLNLVVNASDAMPGGGKMIVETANVSVDEAYAHSHPEIDPGEYVVLTVSDTGDGMDNETVSHIFEPFFTTKDQGKGTGLGLSTVYGIVKQSEGHILVYSELEKGTTFRVYLPLDESEGAKSAQSTRREETPRGNETVLLVEDEEGVRSLVAKSLQMKGYTVLEASHGKEALLVSERFSGNIDLLLTDLVMPQMGGFELAKELASLRPEIATIYMSGYTDRVALQAGLCDSNGSFMQKPFTLDDLATTIRKALDEPNTAGEPDEIREEAPTADSVAQTG